MVEGTAIPGPLLDDNPGMYAFQTVVLFNQGDALAGLRTVVLGGFVVGAMAAGLAAAHFVSEREWLVES